MDNKVQFNLQGLEQELKQLVSTSSGRRSFLKAMPLLLAACSTAPKTRYREGDNSGQAAALTVSQEKKMTAEVLPKMQKDYPKLRDAQLQNYVSSLGQKIVRKNNLVGKPYTYSFSVVDVKYVNAFALPAGTIFVTTPLLAMADSEAELAGVIGHEVGHVKARHSAERMFKAQQEQQKSWLYALGGGLGGALVGFGIGKLVCPPKDKKCLAKAAAYGGGAGALGGLLIQKYGFLANSREDEMEADRIGFRTSTKAGYHKDYVGRFYSKLLKMEQDRKQGGGVLASFADALSTHPPSRERVQQMNEMARNSGGAGQINTDQFAKIRAKAKQISIKRGAKIT